MGALAIADVRENRPLGAPLLLYPYYIEKVRAGALRIRNRTK